MPTESTAPFSEPIEGRIKFVLSEQGRRDSLRRGGNGRQLQEMVGVVDEEDLGAFSVDDQGQVEFNAVSDFFEDDDAIDLPENAQWAETAAALYHIEWKVVPSWEDLLLIARAVKRLKDEGAAIAAVNAKRVANIAKHFLENPSARASRIERDYVIVEGHRFDEFHEVGVAARERWATDQEELKRANRATLAEWVGQHGTENQRQRLAAGLLPWKEAYEAAEDFLFAPLVEFTRYSRFEIDEVCTCESRFEEITGAPASPCKPKFQSVDAKELTAEQWEQYAKIKATVPGATFQLREHTAQCHSEPEPQMKRGVIVKVAMGQLVFKREFAL